MWTSSHILYCPEKEIQTLAENLKSVVIWYSNVSFIPSLFSIPQEHFRFQKYWSSFVFSGTPCCFLFPFLLSSLILPLSWLQPKLRIVAQEISLHVSYNTSFLCLNLTCSHLSHCEVNVPTKVQRAIRTGPWLPFWSCLSLLPLTVPWTWMADLPPGFCNCCSLCLEDSSPHTIPVVHSHVSSLSVPKACYHRELCWPHYPCHRIYPCLPLVSLPPECVFMQSMTLVCLHCYIPSTKT